MPVKKKSTPAFQYRVALLGNPETPDIRFDQAQLGRLVELGFNTVQLNIAWGSRPPGEPLNLEDVLPLPGQTESAQVRACREEIRRRARAAHQHGLRTLFHFGAPHVKNLYRQFSEKNLEKTQKVEACLMLPETTALYQKLFADLARECPEIDDIMVYTYDQEAWLCSEFGECPRCHGVPLHERLPAFLHALRDAWVSGRPKGTMWWEPWELSAGQNFMMAARLPDKNFGLMLHANIGEVQLSRPVDVWFRNMARLGAARGLPVIAELFLSDTNEEVQPFIVPGPRLVYEELAAVAAVAGVSGVKEYFGLLPDHADPNLEMAGQVFSSPGITLEAALKNLAKPYGQGRDDLLAAWEAGAAALATFPWDFCWKLRNLGLRQARHVWAAYNLPGHLVDSPNWCSTRRSHFMTTENDELHPWAYEDIGLRCRVAADLAEEGARRAEAAVAKVPPDRRAAVEEWACGLNAFRHAARSYACHILESLAAENLRDALLLHPSPLGEGGPASGPGEGFRPKNSLPALIQRLRDLLQLDAANQADAPAIRLPEPREVGPYRGHNGANFSAETARPAAEMLAEFDKSPQAWVQNHLGSHPAFVL
jgi:hypothetical protein